MITPRVLFILKRRHTGPVGAWNHSPDGKPLPSGLSISATQMAYALDEQKIPNQLVHVIDNNCIDREVSAYKPTHVIIEAFWVVPDKFDVLRKLHPNVKWIIRNHSKCDFLSHEGGMVGWAIDYVQRGLILACNSPEATADFKRLAVSMQADPKDVVYLPNYYRAERVVKEPLRMVGWKMLRLFGMNGEPPAARDAIDIGCFGAVRPLKNHLHQAMACIEAADRLDVSIRFHINGNRVEGKAEPIMTSLRQLFKRYPQHDLIELPWMEHDEFTKVIASMDMVMQVSNSETFNIVAADAVAHGVPTIVSPEVPWLDNEYHANPNDVEDIARKIKAVWLASGNGALQDDQLRQLQVYAMKSKRLWGEFLTKEPEKI